MKKYAEVYIPKWAQKALCIWSERAYRRGFQHGLVAGEKLNLVSDTNGFDFRYGKKAQNTFPNYANEPLHKMKKVELSVRHLEYDKIPFVETHQDPKGMMLIRQTE